MNGLTILSVKIVTGESLNKTWKTPMQVIETDKGTFIDNIPDEQFGFFKRANPGYDWKQLIGKEVSTIKIFHSKGYDWLNYQM